MQQNFPAPDAFLYPPPWHMQGEAFILNYWLTPSFIQQAQNFRLAPSALGRAVQVLLVRCRSSPVGPYDELLILDHPLMAKRRLSSIPKIFVSAEIAAAHGQQRWGLPKELARFEWDEQGQDVSCAIHFNRQSMALRLRKIKKPRSFYINSHHLPAAMLKISQAQQGKRYQFSPQFRGHFSRLLAAQWQDTQDIFPDFSQARYLQSFYAPEFALALPEAACSANSRGCFT